MEKFLKNNKNLEIMTDTGWSSFKGITVKSVRPVLLLSTKTSSLTCTPEHKIFDINLQPHFAKDLLISSYVKTITGSEQIQNINLIQPETVFDIVGVQKNNRFYANGILVANCKFITFDETLINPFKLNQMQGVEPIEIQGQVRWYCKPSKDNTYIVALDPSLGTGGDPAAIQVFEAKTNKQIAEWTHNKTSIENQVKLMKNINAYLVTITGKTTSIYYSVENNTIGEATLVAIRAIGEENIPGIFLSEPTKLGNVKKFRKGFNTTNSNKLAACAKLKQLIESDKIYLYSRKLISELRTFVSVENTYRAKPGETDDLVTATLTVMRMMETLKNYLPELQEVYATKDEQSIPLPFLMSTTNNYY